jgi:hypothetical protein
MSGMNEVLNIQQSRSRGVVKSISLKLWIREWWQNPNIGARGPEGILENGQDSGVKLLIPTRMTAELRWEDEHVVVGTITVVPALLDPRADLLQKKPDINDELVPSKEHEAGNWVGEGGNHNEPTVLILTSQGRLQLGPIEGSNEVRLT